MADKISGQITVATAGTPVKGPSTGPGDFMIRRHPANTGTYVYVGNDGSDQVHSSSGMVCGAGDTLVITVKSLNEVYFNADANGDKICWFRAFSGNIVG